MNDQLQYLAELLEQIRGLLSRPAASASIETPTDTLSQVEIVNQPVQVRLTGATVQAELDEPIAVEQSGTWNVGITGQPIQVTFSQPTYKYAVISANAAGDTPVVAAVSNKKIRVVAFAIVAAGTVNVKFRRGSTDITGAMRLVEAGGIAHAFEGGLFETDVNQALNINLSANVQVGGYVVYQEV